MEYYVKSVVPIIELNYNNFTMVEKILLIFSFITMRKRTFLQKRWRRNCLYQRLHFANLLGKTYRVVDEG